MERGVGKGRILRLEKDADKQKVGKGKSCRKRRGKQKGGDIEGGTERERWTGLLD